MRQVKRSWGEGRDMVLGKVETNSRKTSFHYTAAEIGLGNPEARLKQLCGGAN